MKKVLCLYRVSTLGQVDPKDDIPMQRRECEDFIARHSDWVYYGERLEKGVFGYKVSANKRDVILEIRAMAERKEFDVLLVFMFDRLGRREDETPFLMQWFIEHGIEVWSTREGRYEWRHESDNAWIPEGQTKTSVYGATLLAGHSVMRTLPPQVGRQLFLQIAENPLLLPLDLSLLQRLHGCQGVRRSVDLFRGQSIYSAKKLEAVVLEIVHDYFRCFQTSVDAIWKKQVRRQMRSKAQAQIKEHERNLEVRSFPHDYSSVLT